MNKSELIHIFIPYGFKMKFMRMFFHQLAKIVPMRKNQYLFISMHGRSYGCNIKYLVQYIQKHALKSTIWVAFDTKFYSIYKNEVDKTVKIGTWKYLWILITSQFVCSNERTNAMEYPFKRKGQIYLQTWHGTGPKKAEADIDWGKNSTYPEYAQKDSDKIDILISGNSYNSTFFRNSFWYKGNIYEIGTPRNDLFFEKHPEINNRVHQVLQIPENKKIILYAPTFRGYSDSLKCYDFDYVRFMHCISNKFGKNYVFVTRLHPDIISGENIEFCKNIFPKSYDASLYPDMQELLYATDILLTDYSSCMFDFFFTKRPCFLYTKDKDEYDRGFYIPIEEWPVPQFANDEEMCNVIEHFDESKYVNEVENFIKRRIGSIEDGHACERCYKLLNDYSYDRTK